MAWVALNCPQCSAPLPRVALWRSVKCSSCGALITRTEAIVMRDSFRQALNRARSTDALSSDCIHCGQESYELLNLLGTGEYSQVYLARRAGLLPFIAILKLASTSSAAARLQQEAVVLRALHAAQSGARVGFCYRHIPLVVTETSVQGTSSRHALVLRQPMNFWGSLAELSAQFPAGLDSRHIVWIWRRMLEVLGFIHDCGFAHGDVRPEHVLIYPQDHAVRLVSWGSGRKLAGPEVKAADLMRSARVALALLSGAGGEGSTPTGTPAGIAALVNRASNDLDYCAAQGAAGLDALLRVAALDAFGPPAFVPLNI
jgi:serine/threonine protein kinase